jgi:uncharacterized protein (DUF697 family)
MTTETAETVKVKSTTKSGPGEEFGSQKEVTEWHVISKKEAIPDPSTRSARVEKIILKNVVWALGIGILPIPVVDLVGVTAVQVKMLKEISDVYDLPFREGIAKKLVGSLLSGLGSVALGSLAVVSLIKFIPAVGMALGGLGVPVFAGAFTYATGKVFMMHFESGGTILDFDPQAVRSHFRAEFEKAKETVSRIKQEEGTRTA